MGDVTLRGHAVICGWNTKGNAIVAQLTHDERKQDIVILAELDSTPIRHAHVHFIHGDPTRESDLRRASVDKAETVIILADESYSGHTDSTIDARSVLVALAVEHANPPVYTFAEVRQPENREHFRHANVDEMLVSNEIVSDLIARASVLHGVSRVISDLLAIGTGSDICIVPPPPSLVGSSFNDAMTKLQNDHRVVLIGVRRKDEIILNPQDALIVNECDSLIVIARAESSLLSERRSVFAS
jgi:voltage-gated potassium channel